MIARLQGRLLARDEAVILVDVGGIAYEVEVSAPTLYQLPESGQEITLHTHFIVREDAQLLFGFLELAERNLFRLLIKANGIGPKLGLAILSGMEAPKLVAAVINGDVAALVKLPGVGRKTAERLVLELRDKMQEWQLQYGTVTPAPALKQVPKSADSWQEAESALVSLGYKPQEAARAVAQAASALEGDGKAVDTSALIRLSLQNLGRAA
ncbi:MAG TPA: Holliday junction branch migration protein RuvA [Candidatus Acidoferrum sp.]|nr:Holliday junction branch migration protein RuvA [Candidatus Acidoferrum sp.]